MRLSVEGLILARGGRRLFDPLTFATTGGAYVEVRGPNGAGKTSLLRAIAGWMRPFDGTIRFEGVEEPALAIAYLGHRDGLKPLLSADAHARHWRALLGGDGDSAEALDRVGLSAVADLPVRAFSQGQQRRLALSRLLIAPRPVWLLDEPAAALDSAGKRLLAEIVSDHVKHGGLVIAAAHEPLGPAPDQILALA
ncbi:MAG: heme ABC exporter ATP-binding protein CcmA [Alphaproteobacteria bacterium]|nr:heme ABC exporter ATP-binding protein CcmA [Alphaproteobacteria bacterium]